MLRRVDLNLCRGGRVEVVPIADHLDQLLLDYRAMDFAKLRVLEDAFPDLTVLRDTDGRSYYCSESANHEVDVMEVRGLDRPTDDAPLRVWTYIVLPVEGRLYSNPPCHVVAHRNARGFGEHPISGWRNAMEGDAINPEVVDKIGEYLEKRPSVSYRE